MKRPLDRPAGKRSRDRRDYRQQRLISVFHRHARVEPGEPAPVCRMLLKKTGDGNERPFIRTQIPEERGGEQLTANISVSNRKARMQEIQQRTRFQHPYFQESAVHAETILPFPPSRAQRVRHTGGRREAAS